MEDVFVGIQVSKLKDVQVQNYAENFQMEFEGTEGCGYNNLFVAHPVDPDEQLDMLLEAYKAHITCKEALT